VCFGVLVVLVLTAMALLAACGGSSANSTSPAQASLTNAAFVHPRVTDVTWCWDCHPGVFSQWKASTTYTSAAYGALRGHNVNMVQTLTDAEHNGGEQLVNDCVQCHSPFGARHQDGATPTKIGELVTPIDLKGNPPGTWSLVAPYTSLSTSPAGLYLPADHPADTAHAAWEGISCRVCHDTAHLTELPDGSRVPTLAFFNPGAVVNASLPAYTYAPVPLAGAGRPDVTWLCDQCHQPNSDDTRNATAASVHAGLSCMDCHGQVNKRAGEPFNHDLNAGKAGAPIAQTSCARCHGGKAGIASGHPDVTKLATSLTNHGLYGADPAGDLQVNGVKWHNIHFITCDTCHLPTVQKKTYAVVYGKPLTISGRRTSQNLQNLAPDADGGSVALWTVPAGDKDGARVAETGEGAPGSTFTLTGYLPTKSGPLFVTQALPMKPDPAHSVITLTFPGMGRGIEVDVNVSASVTISASQRRVGAGASVVLSGTVGPNEAGRKITIQSSRSGGPWVGVATLSLSSASAYSTDWKAPAAAGGYSFRAAYVGDKHVASNQSAPIVVTVL
jgi:hypothetical protein